MNVLYQYLGKEITAQQVSTLGTYEKLFKLESGLVKKKELFMNGEMYNIEYYKDTDETEESAIQALLPYKTNYNIYTRQSYNSYTIENANLYLNDQKMAMIRNLIDQNNETVCFQELDLISGLPILEETTKYLGHYEDERSTHYSTFHYNADGSLFYCEFNYMSDYDTEEFHQDNIHLIREKFVLTDQMYNYYLTAEFLPPLV